MVTITNIPNILAAMDVLKGQAAQFLNRADQAKAAGNPDMELRGDAISCDYAAGVLEELIREQSYYDARTIPFWITYQGDVLSLNDMSDQHVVNCFYWTKERVQGYGEMTVKKFEREIKYRNLTEDFVKNGPYPHKNNGGDLVRLSDDGGIIHEIKEEAQ